MILGTYHHVVCGIQASMFSYKIFLSREGKKPHLSFEGLYSSNNKQLVSMQTSHQECQHCGFTPLAKSIRFSRNNITSRLSKIRVTLVVCFQMWERKDCDNNKCMCWFTQWLDDWTFSNLIWSDCICVGKADVLYRWWHFSPAKCTTLDMGRTIGGHGWHGTNLIHNYWTTNGI